MVRTDFDKTFYRQKDLIDIRVIEEPYKKFWYFCHIAHPEDFVETYSSGIGKGLPKYDGTLRDRGREALHLYRDSSRRRL